MIQEDKTKSKIQLFTGSRDEVNMAEWKRLPAHDENFTEPSGLDRRDALKIMGASAALAVGIPGCKRKPVRYIVARNEMPEYQEPGKVLEYSSTWTDGDFPYGMIVKVVDGRPIKIEGNPDHPVNGESTNAQMQASTLSLYDPDRMKEPSIGGSVADWKKADAQVVQAIKGAGSVVLMTKSTLGPSEREWVEHFLKAKPGAKHFVYESVHDTNRRNAWKKVFGKDGELIADYSKAKIILSVGCDFLGTEPLSVEATRQFAQGRRALDDGTDVKMNRLYVAEAGMSVTGSNADHRIRIKPSEMLKLVHGLRYALGGQMQKLTEFVEANHLDRKVFEALAEDLSANRGKCLVVAGQEMPESVHAAVALLNNDLGNFEKASKVFRWNPLASRLSVSDTEEIKSTLQAGVDVLICMGVNPVYDWPGGGFKTLLAKAKTSVGHGLYANETVSECTVGLPSSHNLESWNDAVARMGVLSICQPVIRPLWKSRQEAESLMLWTQQISDDAKLKGFKDWHDVIKKNWITKLYPGVKNGKIKWQDGLRSGVSVSTTFPLRAKLDTDKALELASQAMPEGGAFEVVVLPDAGVHDGRFANLSWLQECPDPVTRLVWDNAAMISPKTAISLQVSEGNLDQGDVVGDVLDVSVNGQIVKLPVLIQPGIADNVIVTTQGYGRTKVGRVGNDKGKNVSVLVSGNGGWIQTSAKVSKAAERYPLVKTQKYFKLEDDKMDHDEFRHIAIDGTLSEYKKDPGFAKHRYHIPKQVDIYNSPYDYTKGYKWEMHIDMNKCTGCHACVTACQAENNIPVVGKDECANGREMHWMRIDRYHTFDPSDTEEANPTVHQQPMLCQQCDNAPCENVCPVNATSHSPEGLNDMTYNRCVGTRYCANNCPYKVRRFNFYEYHDRNEAALINKKQLPQFNPQVTVRMRGVMEKCSFCVQRINTGKYHATNQGRDVLDGEIKTACQQVCPSNAIVFGNINGKGADGTGVSQVRKFKDAKLSYNVLEELNVKPGIAYGAKVRNPHPDLAKAVPAHHNHHGSSGSDGTHNHDHAHGDHG